MDERPLAAAAPTFVVRRATAADAATVAAMRTASHGERYNEDPRREEEFRAECESFFDRELAQPDSFVRVWLAVEPGDRGRAIGTAALTLSPTLPRITEPRRRFDARVRNVYVVPDARRSGVARELMRVLMDEVRGAGIARLTLGASTMGRPLYEALGFRPKDDEMVYEFDAASNESTR